VRCRRPSLVVLTAAPILVVNWTPTIRAKITHDPTAIQ
jgi:hypothetical protein